MKVVHVVPAITEEASGPSYSVVRLCESLIEAGGQVTLAAMDWGSIACPPACLRTFPMGVGPRRLGRSPAMSRWLEEQARSGQVDVLHNHGMWQMNAVYPGRVAARNGTPYVVSPRGTWSAWAMANGSVTKKPFWSILQRPAVQSATCFHATAESEYEDIRRLGFRQPVAVLPNGIDIPPSMEKTGGGLRTVLFLGRIHPKKGLDVLLRAWGAVQSRFPGWRLRIVGSDDGYHGSSGYLAEVKTLAVELGLERLEFSGALRGIAKWQAYADADLFVLPTHSENFGMSVAEALASGTPALVSNGAPWSGLEARRAGRWIDIGVDPLVAGFADLLQREPRELRDMGINGRTWMTEAYSWRTIGQRMAELYHWLARGTSAVPSFVITS
jgi:glycosyltransferase involved in cell wall biosynthesis